MDWHMTQNGKRNWHRCSLQQSCWLLCTAPSFLHTVHLVEDEWTIDRGPELPAIRGDGVDISCDDVECTDVGWWMFLSYFQADMHRISDIGYRIATINSVWQTSVPDGQDTPEPFYNQNNTSTTWLYREMLRNWATLFYRENVHY